MMESLDLSGFFLSNVVIAFIFLLKKPTMTSGQFSVIGPAGPIQASLGGEAELSCYLSPPQSAQHMEVVWLQFTRVVHHYRDGKDQFGDQAPDYQGRTELVKDPITHGNVTLKIRDVRFLDAGRYTCLFEDGFHQEDANMELKVRGEPRPVLDMFMNMYGGRRDVFPALL
ncbi:myelin-oligodendrocyte glycoprotein-like [Sminthopsis crassicaudata]|uniref:myelin-oligodendrocyte glycoprotein-like n=1 Tax=Sminthopsis crassicaudata TaxID=9301 RepID=UPI003D69A319